MTVRQVSDLKGFSFRFAYDFEVYEFVGVEKRALTRGVKDHPVFLNGKAVNGQIWIDGAVIGAGAERERRAVRNLSAPPDE